MNNSKNIKYFVQARLGSKRFPRKTFSKFDNGKTLLEMVLQNLLEVKSIKKEQIIILTSTNKIDDEIDSFANNNSFNCFRGDEDNVLKRFLDALDFYDADYVVRICADNPFLQPIFIDTLINSIEKDLEFDYLSFETSKGIPAIRTHFGIFAEIINKKAFNSIQNYSLKAADKEHVTKYFYENKDVFNCRGVKIPNNIEKLNFRLTIDTKEDSEIANRIMKAVDYQVTNFDRILNYLTDNPKIIKQMKTQIDKHNK